jgi:hypothetical protein
VLDDDEVETLVARARIVFSFVSSFDLSIRGCFFTMRALRAAPGCLNSIGDAGALGVVLLFVLRLLIGGGVWGRMGLPKLLVSNFLTTV